MDYMTHKETNIMVLDLNGEIDANYAPYLRDKLVELIQGNNGRLLVNLHNVDYIDSAGLGVLIVAHRKALAAGGFMGLSNPQRTVQKVFELTRTNKVFDIFATVEEGIVQLSSR